MVFHRRPLHPRYGGDVLDILRFAIHLHGDGLPSLQRELDIMDLLHGTPQ